MEADWVAMGRIIKVKHHPEGPPLAKDFAEFEFEVTQIEKGPVPQAPLRFKIGWCTNQIELPADTGGLFRLYGSNKTDPNNPGRLLYLDFERTTGAGR